MQHDILVLAIIHNNLQRKKALSPTHIIFKGHTGRGPVIHTEAAHWCMNQDHSTAQH